MNEADLTAKDHVSFARREGEIRRTEGQSAGEDDAGDDERDCRVGVVFPRVVGQPDDQSSTDDTDVSELCRIASAIDFQDKGRDVQHHREHAKRHLAYSSSPRESDHRVLRSPPRDRDPRGHVPPPRDHVQHANVPDRHSSSSRCSSSVCAQPAP